LIISCNCVRNNYYEIMITDQEKIRKKYELLKSNLNERQRRLFAWAEASILWYWWIEIVSQWTWMARNTVKKGKEELEKSEEIIKNNRIRKAWWGRKKEIEKNPEMKKKFQKAWFPVLSVDTKKKELIGNFKNNWKEWQKKWDPKKVKVYDFLTEAEGKAVPYWVYDIVNNEWRVNIGISADTSQFAVESIRKRRKQLGDKRYSSIKKILITADWWWSNGYRVRLRKIEIQKILNDYK